LLWENRSGRSEPNYVHSLFELGEIEADLSDAAGTKVQIMTKDSSLLIANPFLSRSIEKDRRELLKV
jgi:predicted nucleotidyltransferase